MRGQTQDRESLASFHLHTSHCTSLQSEVHGAGGYREQSDKLAFKFNRWESLASQFINGLASYLNITHMYYMCVFKFVKSALCLSCFE